MGKQPRRARSTALKRRRVEGESEEADGGGDNGMEAIDLATGGGGVRAASGAAGERARDGLTGKA